MTDFPLVVDLATLTTDEGFAIVGGAAGDAAARSISSGGDINGDGLADIVIGAQYADDNGTSAGAAYVVYGRSGRPGPIDLGALAVADGFVIKGEEAFDRVGTSVAGAGDVNGDGMADFQLVMPGAGTLVAGDFVL